MTSISRLKLVMGAGDPDPTLALRIDVVSAAVKVLEVDEKTSQDFTAEEWKAWEIEFSLAMERLLNLTRKYREAIRKRTQS